MADDGRAPGGEQAGIRSDEALSAVADGAPQQAHADVVQEHAVAAPTVNRLVCLVRSHRWTVEHNHQTQGTELTCSCCGARRSTYPGGIEQGLRGRHPSPGSQGPTRNDF